MAPPFDYAQGRVVPLRGLDAGLKPPALSQKQGQRRDRRETNAMKEHAGWGISATSKSKLADN